MAWPTPPPCLATKGPPGLGKKWSYRPLVCTSLNKLEVSVPGAVELILITELLHSGQQVVGAASELRAAQALRVKAEFHRSDFGPPRNAATEAMA